jgi:long-subunit acyl-CoA synthetase (AMP-forming)
LPHCQVRVARNGEIEVAGSSFLGYVGEHGLPRGSWLATGDIGSIDADGYLHLQGRSRNVLITAFGRNVSPEWVETVLREEAAILHAAVLGDGEPQLRAVLWPMDPRADDAVLERAVAAANAALPDYARVGHWVRARAPVSAESGLATPNGRPRRDAIARLHMRSLSAQ